jgi:hypothetical protein
MIAEEKNVKSQIEGLAAFPRGVHPGDGDEGQVSPGESLNRAFDGVAEDFPGLRSGHLLGQHFLQARQRPGGGIEVCPPDRHEKVVGPGLHSFGRGRFISASRVLLASVPMRATALSTPGSFSILAERYMRTMESRYSWRRTRAFTIEESVNPISLGIFQGAQKRGDPILTNPE